VSGSLKVDLSADEEPAPESTGDRQRRCQNQEYFVNGVHLGRPTTLSSQFIQFLEMRREMIHIVCYVLLRKNELGVVGVGDVVARGIPRATPSLRLWSAFRVLRRHRHRQALRCGKGSKDVSFFLSHFIHCPSRASLPASSSDIRASIRATKALT